MRGETSGQRAPTVEPFGDRALLLTLGDAIAPSINAQVHRLAAVLRDAAPVGLGVPVPAYATLLVPFDPARTSTEAARRAVDDALQRVLDETVVNDLPEPSAVAIPVSYGGTDGPDLGDVAARLRLSEREVVALHSGTVYRVYMLGFSPGFAYLGTLPEELALPRRAEPRVRVPVGSVAIAERQTAVYPSATAGGWHLIGRTEMAMWDPAADPPARLAPGQRVRFVPA